MLLLRHGQSEFNVVFGATGRDPGIEDPKLTPLGVDQAREAAEALAGHDVRRIITSPYTRALQTAEIVAEHVGVPVSVEAFVREHCHFVCDIGTPARELGRTWPDWSFDHLDEQWWPPEMNESDEQVRARGLAFAEKAFQEEDWRHVAVVCHWGFIRGLTGLRVQNCSIVRVTSPDGAAADLVHAPGAC